MEFTANDFVPGPEEARDLLYAWVILGLAFTLFYEGTTIFRNPEAAVIPFAVVLVTVGAGFLLHELAHKVVAVRYGQVAAFRADYGMLFLAVMGGLIGIIFAAPGAVHHRGNITKAQHGHVALAGPVTNLVLAALFAPLWIVGIAPPVGARGVGINLLLAGFNMLPVRGLDGRTVWEWNRVVYLAVAIPAAALGIAVIGTGLGF